MMSNLVLLVRPLELLQYATTLCVLCACPPHICRRLGEIERDRSKLFLRGLQFFLLTSTALGFIVLIVPRHLPLLARYVPQGGWQRDLLFAGAMLVAPLVAVVIYPFLRLAIVFTGLMIPKNRLIDPEAWWTIPFLFDTKTWKKTRTPEVFEYLLYAGPYVILTSSLIACATYLPFWNLELMAARNPGELTPAGSVLFFRFVWIAFWALLAERVVVNSFAAGLPAVMCAPTYAMTRMILPKLSQNLTRLNTITIALDRCRSVQEARVLGKPLAEVMADIECDVAVWRSLHFPFQTDFTKLYSASLLLNTLKRLFEEEPCALEHINHLSAVLEGTIPTHFEDGSLDV